MITLQTLLIYLLIGALLGLLLGAALKGGGFGWFGNLCLGILGACIGGLVATYTNYSIDNNLITNLVAAGTGTLLFTLLIGIFKRH